jgi:hypothetical protein
MLTKRRDKALSKFKLGTSAAASWAWGTSLIMGQQIAQEKGITAWVIWAVCNTLTLALFGFLSKKGYLSADIYRRKEVKIIAVIIQLFCLLVQLNFINKQFLTITGNEIMSYIITALIGIGFTLMVFKKGLPTSVKTDVAQWIMAIGVVIAIIAVGKFGGAELQTFAPTSSSGITWGIWSGLILFAGPIGDVQHWQRAEADKSGKAYYIGAVLFGLYMLLILGMSLFKFNKAMDILLLIAVLGITTSTIDSIAVALHELGNKKVGTGASIALCLLFGLFVKMGMIDLWASFGVIRFAFAVGMLLLPFALKGNKAVVLPALAIGVTTVGYFTINGQIVIGSTAGIMSIVVSAMIFAYVAIRACIKSNAQS